MSATILGFGGTAPNAILDVLSRLVSSGSIFSVRLERSQSIQLALCETPYRTFLSGYKKSSSKANVLVYCLPTSISEYLSFGNEANIVRTAIMSPNHTLVVVYDPKAKAFLGGSIADIIFASTPSGQNNFDIIRSNFASAGLHALSSLDSLAAHHYVRTVQQSDVVIVIGSGGREHAIAVSLARSPLISKILCCPGNGGTATEGGKISNVMNVVSNHDIIELVRRSNASMVVVGPEQPLVDGLIDALKTSCPDVKAFGPSKDAAQLEASKAFAKDFLNECGIPTAQYRTFTDAKEAVAYVESLSEDDRQVVKASGLAAGKGVLIPTNKVETIAAVREIMTDQIYGDAGNTCVIESFLTGPEASCLAFCDGKTAVLMPAAQDHKRALDNDMGLNTGGMGAYAPAPCVTPYLHKKIEEICQLTVQKMAERGTPYVGILYAGMMLTPGGPYVLEFNCRFGDPETQVLLPLLECDLYEVLQACCDGKLDSVDVRFKENTYATTIVCAAKGYPEAYAKGMSITGLSNASVLSGVKVYHAGTKIDEGNTLRCTGGRVLAVTGVGSDLQDALKKAYSTVKKINFVSDKNEPLIHFRNDIASRAINRKLRVGVLGSTRGTALIPVIEACASGSLSAEIVAVVSNEENALILEKGRTLGVGTITKYISSKGLSRSQFDAECTAVLVKAGVDFVILVGYMRILSKPFCDYWSGRCINVHPSLLPKYAGMMDLAVHQAVIDAGETESGCTIHQVTESVDGGPIIVQRKVQVEINDTAETLKAKVQALEGPAFVEAVSKFCGKIAITYTDAGVDIDAGDELVEVIKPACRSTRRLGCDSELGGFGGLFDLAAAGYNGTDTILIGATDGVGTKLKIAHITQKHDFVGIDLVAMCVNDLIVAGGEPLFFLDYYATGHLQVKEAAAVIKGIAEGCRQANCGLIGGETAEMPSMYLPGDYDLAGFAVGAVERSKILPRNVKVGDVLLGLTSSGVHSNGFSLVRKLVETEQLSYESPCPWDSSIPTVGDALLIPTKIYVKCTLPLLKKSLLNGMAHITGGGLLDNLPRSLPEGLVAEIVNFPPLPPVFKWLQIASGLDDYSMLRTFNCGIGMVLILDRENVEETKYILNEYGESAIELGRLVHGSGPQVVVTNPLV